MKPIEKKTEVFVSEKAVPFIEEAIGKPLVEKTFTREDMRKAFNMGRKGFGGSFKHKVYDYSSFEEWFDKNY